MRLCVWVWQVQLCCLPPAFQRHVVLACQRDAAPCNQVTPPQHFKHQHVPKTGQDTLAMRAKVARWMLGVGMRGDSCSLFIHNAMRCLCALSGVCCV